MYIGKYIRIIVVIVIRATSICGEAFLYFSNQYLTTPRSSGKSTVSDARKPCLSSESIEIFCGLFFALIGIVDDSYSITLSIHRLHSFF